MAEIKPQGREQTPEDVILRAFQEKHLGPDASPEDVKEWIGWVFPSIRLDDDYRAQIEAQRRKIKADG